MEGLTECNPAWIDDELWENACEPDCEEIEAVYRKLKEYEDLEEQGRLLKLPCKVGDVVYIITPKCRKCKNKIGFEDFDDENFLENFLYKGFGALEAKVNEISIWENTTYIVTDCGYYKKEDIFLTKSEAEAKLKELGGIDNVE